MVCEENPDECVKPRSCVKDLMNQWVIQFNKAKDVEEVSTIKLFTIIYIKKQVEVPVKKI